MLRKRLLDLDKSMYCKLCADSSERTQEILQVGRNFSHSSVDRVRASLQSERSRVLIRGTKRLVSENICSEEGNSAAISKKWNFRIKGKVNGYYFRRVKTAILGAIKAQLAFSEGKYQLLNSWNTISFPTIFYHLNFQLPHPNRSNSVSHVSSHKCPFKRQ